MKELLILMMTIFTANIQCMSREKLQVPVANSEQKDCSNSQQASPQPSKQTRLQDVQKSVEEQNSLSQEEKNMRQNEMIIYICRRLNCPCAIDEMFHRDPRG